MDELFERHAWDDSESEKKQKGVYYFRSEKELPDAIKEEIEAIDRPELMVEIEGIIENKKWKSYLNKDQFLVLNENEKLIWSNGSETHTGSWEYMPHSSLLLLTFIQPTKVQHLVYQILHCTDELLLLKPQHSKSAEYPYYEMYYFGRKPSQATIKEVLIHETEQDNKDWLIYLTAAILLFLLILYFMIIY